MFFVDDLENFSTQSLENLPTKSFFHLQKKENKKLINLKLCIFKKKTFIFKFRTINLNKFFLCFFFAPTLKTVKLEDNVHPFELTFCFVLLFGFFSLSRYKVLNVLFSCTENPICFIVFLDEYEVNYQKFSSGYSTQFFLFHLF
jgi:hypothetical protein